MACSRVCEYRLETNASVWHVRRVRRIERTFEVSYRHRVLFTRGIFLSAIPLLAGLLTGSAVRRPVRALITLDAGVAETVPGLGTAIRDWFAAHAEEVALVREPLVLPGGEQAKEEPGQVTQIHALIDRHAICRHSFVIAIGGGAHLDVAGFAAATAHRGIRHLRLPTTVLAQADSGVGVKNGINAFGKKNFIGAFAPPFAVVNDLDWLEHLADRDRRSGLAEAVKVGLIRDREFFEAMERDAGALAGFDREAMERVVIRCAELHVEHIATGGDPFELGSARPLDFGHWAAHKLETLSGYRLRHGEAVAIGLAWDTLYSARSGLIAASDAERVLRLLERLGFALTAPELEKCETDGCPSVLRGLEEFREHLGGQLTVTLL
ncbi:MAG: 3-dehydroquinate synthase, partial [Verrucomicrobiae bacterium]|nr:3-dehydroquinate synthase [Verrucomicrobiae bacterium]